MTRKKYHFLSILLHWLIFLLFIVGLVAIEYRDSIPRNDLLRGTLMYLHAQAGLLIFLFFLVRAAARWRFGIPDEIAGPRWQTLGAKMVHFLLYFVMFALPVTGILFTQAAGYDVVFFGWQLPRFIASSQELYDVLKAFHQLTGTSVYFLVGVHIAGSFWHQFARKNDIFQRMSWFRKN